MPQNRPRRPEHMKSPLVLLPLLAVLSACQSSLPLTGPNEPEIVQTLQEAPPGAAPGTCWGKDVTPAVIETVTEEVLLQPAQVRNDGTVEEPAIYKTETRQRSEERRV